MLRGRVQTQLSVQILLWSYSAPPPLPPFPPEQSAIPLFRTQKYCGCCGLRQVFGIVVVALSLDSNEFAVKGINILKTGFLVKEIIIEEMNVRTLV